MAAITTCTQRFVIVVESESPPLIFTGRVRRALACNVAGIVTHFAPRRSFLAATMTTAEDKKFPFAPVTAPCTALPSVTALVEEFRPAPLAGMQPGTGGFPVTPAQLLLDGLDAFAVGVAVVAAGGGVAGDTGARAP